MTCNKSGWCAPELGEGSKGRLGPTAAQQAEAAHQRDAEAIAELRGRLLPGVQPSSPILKFTERLS